jgi:hypothetical protein
MENNKYQKIVIGLSIIVNAGLTPVVFYFFIWLFGITEKLVEQGGLGIHLRVIAMVVLSAVTLGVSCFILIKIITKLLQVLRGTA